MLLCTFAHMKIKQRLTVFLVVATPFVFAQETQNTPPSKSIHISSPKPQAFQDGEWFKFRLHYGIFNASYATIELKEDQWNGMPVFHAKGVGKTTGLARWFFKVDDYYDSYFTKDVIRPVYFIRNINEGGYKKHTNIQFDHNASKAHVQNVLKNEKNTFKTDSNIQDLISCFYFLRSQVDTSSLKKGAFIVVNLFFDESNYAFKFKYLGAETIKTKFGWVKTLVFRPYVQSGRVFRSSESITLWVSDDDNKIPLRLHADLRVGSITADLDEFKGLKNPFEIVVQ